MDYTSIQAAANSALVEAGTGRTLTRTVSVFNAGTGKSTETVSTYTVTGVLVGISHKMPFSLAVDKFTIQQGDAMMLVSATGQAPIQNDNIDGWTVLGVDTVKPANVAVLYKCHMRKQ